MTKSSDKASFDADAVRKHLSALKLAFMLEHHQTLAQVAVDKPWSHLEYLSELVNGEAGARDDRRVVRCIAQARFPVLKTLDQFDWNWPTKINRLLIQNLFHLDFVKQHANVVFVSGTGLGKSHLMAALAQYVKPQVLCIDELGYLPIDKFGADCLFQILSHRYERGSTLITTNRVFKQWASIFNNDAVLTSALLDRLLHHVETVRIEGKSYRSKDQIEI